MMGACQHEFAKVIEDPVGLEHMDGYRIPPCCIRWQCIHCGIYEDDLEDDTDAFY